MAGTEDYVAGFMFGAQIKGIFYILCKVRIEIHM